MIQPAYTTGIVRMAAGSPIVRGEGTAWVLGLVNGGLLTFGGRAIPIASVESNTQLTLAYPSPAAFEGIYAIDLGRADAASAIVANRRLAELLTGLSAISPFGSQLTSAEDAAEARGLIEALQDIAASRVFLGRASPNNGPIEQMSTAQAKALLSLSVDDVAGLQAALAAKLSTSGGVLSGNLANSAPPGNGIYAVDTSPAVVTIATGGSFIAWSFSGMILVTNRNSGGSVLLLCGGGGISKIAEIGTHGTADYIHAPDQNGYAWFNRGGPANFGVQLFRTRSGA